MKKQRFTSNIIQLPYLLGLVALFSALLACAAPGISVKSSSGFTHETSVRVPFHPPDDALARLYIDDEGTAVFAKYIEIHHGSVNPRKEFWLEIYRVDKNGVLDTEELGPFEAIQSLDMQGNFLALGNSDNFTWLNVLNSVSRSVIDSDLADIIRNQYYSADYYDSGLVVYRIPVPEKPGSERGVVIHNTSTREEIRVNFEEEYVSIESIDMDGENLLIKAVRSNREPPDLYVLGLDGTNKLKLTLSYCKDPYSDDAKLVPGALLVATSDVIVVDTSNATSQISRASKVERYTFDGTLEWSKSIPLNGIPCLKLLNQKTDILAFTIINRNELTGFISYFNAEDGEQLYADTFQSDFSILPLDTPGNFYIYPQWSLYPEIPPPTGRVAFYSYDNELGTIDFSEGFYYFAASPSGKFFAVVSDRTLSIFSTVKTGG